MWKKLDKFVSGLGTTMSVLSVLTLFVLGILQVLFRFVIKISVPWTEELMRALYIYLVFFGIILVERENGEVRTTMLIEKLPPRLYHAWECVVSVLSIIFNVVVFFGSIIAFRETISYLGALPSVSQKIFFIPLLIGLPCMVLYQCFHLVQNFRAMLGIRKEAHE